MMPAPDPAATGPSTGLNHRFLWTISLVAAMGGLLFGYDWVVIGGAKPFFEPFFGITRDVVDGGGARLATNDTLSGWVNSCALLGCLLGSLFTGGLSDRYGRRRLLVLSAVLFAVSSVLTGWAGSLAGFIVWRVVGGVAIGMASNLSPMYIAEVAPAHLRGRLVAMNQLTIVLGIMAAQIANWAIAQPVPEHATAGWIRESWNGQNGWRWMFTAVTVPSILFFIGALCIPESPRPLLWTRCGRCGLPTCWSRGFGGSWWWGYCWPCCSNGAASTRSSIMRRRSIAPPDTG